MASILLLGATGMTGSHILSTLRSLPSTTISTIDLLARRATTQTSSDSNTSTSLNPTVRPYISTDTTTWSSHVTSLTPAPEIMFSSLATTRAAAGGFDKQYALEHDLNISLARAAREKGTKTYVLISASGADAQSRIPYTRMKGEIEEHIRELDFEHTVILRPGLIGGTREESRPAEAAIRMLADGLGRVSGGLLKDFWAQDADVIARAAVSAGLAASRGESKEKVMIYSGSDIMRLGKKEWKETQIVESKS